MSAEKNQNAVDPRDAAALAVVLVRSEEYGNEVVVRTAEMSNMHGALEIALTATRHPGVEYLDIALEATYDAHGAHLVPESDDVVAAILADDELTLIDKSVTVTVTLAAKFFVSELALIPVIGSIRADVTALFEDLPIYVSKTVFLVVEPAPAAQEGPST